MKLIPHLIILFPLFFCASTNASPAEARGTCRHPIVRREWRRLGELQQLDYIRAVKCLQAKPPLTPTGVAPGTGSRYDDLIVTHVQQTYTVHLVGHFLPWHRFTMAAYEKALRDECGYHVAQPYWDWTLDVPASKFLDSPLFHPIFGFGGSGPYLPTPTATHPDYVIPGRTGGGCVTTGPFKNMEVRLGPGDDLKGNLRCLHRDMSPYFAGRYLGMNVTSLVMSQPDYGWFYRTLDGGTNPDRSSIHGGGHYAIGGNRGEMGDLHVSPTDPLFYMHHTNLDRVWWSWQKKDLPARLADISGPIDILDYDNVIGGNVTLDFLLTLGVNAADVKIGDMMDIRGGKLCYVYDQVYT